MSSELLTETRTAKCPTPTTACARTRNEGPRIPPERQAHVVHVKSLGRLGIEGAGYVGEALVLVTLGLIAASLLA